jgi:hypothetical protein
MTPPTDCDITGWEDGFLYVDERFTFGQEFMSRKIFCDKCGRELKLSEVNQLSGYDLCKECCREIVNKK